MQEIKEQTGKHLNELMTNIEYIQRVDDYLNICSSNVMTITANNNYLKGPLLNDINNSDNNSINSNFTDSCDDLSLPLDSFHFFQHASNNYQVLPVRLNCLIILNYFFIYNLEINFQSSLYYESK